MRRVGILLIIIAFTISGCASNGKLENRKWYLLEIEGDESIININDKKPFIEFDLQSNKIGGNATCNNFFANYSIDGQSIKLGTIATTMMSCTDDTKQEYRFLQALKRVDSYRIEGENLYLYEGDRIILLFK